MNPFPGLHPYFQDRWSDVHGALIQFVREQISGELPDDLTALTEESITVESDGDVRRYRPDAAISETWRDGFPPVWQPQESERAITVAEPLVFYVESMIQRRVEVREKDGRIVTVIEILSPSNKTDEGGSDYRRKQRDFIASGVSLVELDFIRGGRHITAVSDELLRFPAPTCHHICVARRGSVSRREIYFCPLRTPLPAIRVPLRPTDRDIPLDLQPLIDRIYQVGRWWLHDFLKAPEPPVAPEDAEWVAERLRAEGLRQ